MRYRDWNFFYLWENNRISGNFPKGFYASETFLPAFVSDFIKCDPSSGTSIVLVSKMVAVDVKSLPENKQRQASVFNFFICLSNDTRQKTTKGSSFRGRQPTARVPYLARQAISNLTQKLLVLRINFVMFYTEGILNLTRIKTRMLLAHKMIWNLSGHTVANRLQTPAGTFHSVFAFEQRSSTTETTCFPF